jgi:hypothetical protein
MAMLAPKILIVGHSHMGALRRANAADNTFDFISLMKAEGLPNFLKTPLDTTPYTAVVTTIRGSKHNVIGLVNHQKPFDFILPSDPDLPLRQGVEILPFAVVEAMFTHECIGTLAILKKLRKKIPGPLFTLDPPPPIPDASYIEQNASNFAEKVQQQGVAPAAFRYKLWKLQSQILQKFCQELGVIHLPVPAEALDAQGFLAQAYWHLDPTHGNPQYGALVLQQLRQLLLETEPAQWPTPPAKPTVFAGKSVTPYNELPDHCFWRRGLPASDELIDLPFPLKFKITPQDKVATAGSCFAQHISRYLHNSGFSSLVTEPKHPLLSAEQAQECNYGTFTARYGNIYTTRQLVQLFERAYGKFTPQEDFWTDATGRFIDPFRPQIQPGGFVSLEELQLDRQRHLAAVREAFETVDIFVFTLGLTEAWRSRADGAVFPLCPGVAGGIFDAEKYEFHNFNVQEVCADLEQFLAQLASVNPKARVIFTVSPVPLMATAIAQQHVLLSTTYSKSVLRVACEMVSTQHAHVTYFPSYEVITGNHARGQYYAADLRGVTESGVVHVMGMFFKHFTDMAQLATRNSQAHAGKENDQHTQEMEEAAQVNCDEEALGRIHT